MVYPNLEKDEISSISDYVISPNQLTITTIVSIDPDCKKIISNGIGKVESLHGKSMESIESQANSDTAASYEKKIEKERWYNITVQIFIPFMVAGVGTIGAGIVLGRVEDLAVFQDIKALFILVPALLGLKGNLDMCLASRLSTQANLGNLNVKREIFKMIVGNISLVQVQAIVASCLVSIFAVSASGLTTGTFDYEHALLLAASSLLTATLSCFILDFVLIAVIFLSKRLKLNPDNLATPLAASIGDVVSLLVLSTWAKLLYSIHETHAYILIIIVCTYLCILLPIWILIVRKNKYTKKILSSGWTPVLSALIISGCGGLVLDKAVDEFEGFVVFQPIINGIGGNLVSVQASRISTMLHKTSLKGIIPSHTKQWVAPWTALFSGVLPSKTARILILMSIPGQTVFVFAADFIYQHYNTSIDYVFVLTYLSVGLIQIMALLYIAHIMIHTMWRHKIDPDNSAIPYLTALGDLFGSTLLLLAFMFLRHINHEYQEYIEID